MRKRFSGFVLSLSLFILSSSALASSYTKHLLSDGSISLSQTDDAGNTETKVFPEDILVHMTFNGGNVDAEFDVPPFIENGRTMVPIGHLQRLLGATVEWDATTQKVTIKSNTKVNHVFVMQIESTKATLDGNLITMDVAPQIIMGRTIVPIRAVKSAFSNVQLSWNPENRIVDVTQKNY